MLGADAAEGKRLVEEARAAGMNLVDTSSAYGLSEYVIGTAACDDLLVASKFGNPTHQNPAHDWSRAVWRKRVPSTPRFPSRGASAPSATAPALNKRIASVAQNPPYSVNGS